MAFFIQRQLQLEPGVSCYITTLEDKLYAISWHRETRFPNHTPGQTFTAAMNFGDYQTILDQTEQQIREYWNGQRKFFDLPLELKGSEFQLRVWDYLRQIPYGQTCSYRDVAQAIGQRKACRAVGMANSKNPISLIIPCHRVIAANGSLGGYGGGLVLKRLLLEKEKTFEFEI